MCVTRLGAQQSIKRIASWRRRGGYDVSDKEALAYSCKSQNLVDYTQWLEFKAKTWDQKWLEKSDYFLLHERKTRFQSKQRALTKATRLLTAGREDCVIVWGDGSVNAPVIKGTPKAPNQYFYKHLVRCGYTVIISSERNTSKACEGCKEDVYHPRRRHIPFCGFCGCHDAECGVCMATPCRTCQKRKRRFDRISCCRHCKTMRDRDLAAAKNIKDLFWATVLVGTETTHVSTSDRTAEHFADRSLVEAGHVTVFGHMTDEPCRNYRQSPRRS